MDRNALYYGDNLEILRKHVQDDGVDLVYLDQYAASMRADPLAGFVWNADQWDLE